MKLSQKDKEKLKDPMWRLQHLYYITNKSKKRVKFKPNSIQRYLLKNMTGYDNILKARQVGISTFLLLRKLDKAAFNSNQTEVILSHDRESLGKLFKIIRYAYKNMPDDLRPEIDKGGGSRYRLYFPEINSEIYCTLEAVSDAVSGLHISEMALMNNMDKVRTSMDAVPIETGEISIETTARGFNHYHDFYTGETGYKNFFFPWYMHEEYCLNRGKIRWTAEEKQLKHKAIKLYGVELNDDQISFRRFKISQRKSKSSFLQEYPEDDKTCFITTGTPAIDITKIQDIIKDRPEPIRETEYLKVYIEAISGTPYVFGVDTAEGVGGDYSVAVVMDSKKREVVAILRGHLKPFDFANEINKLAKDYRRGRAPMPLVGVERNNHGHAVLLELKEHLNYPNLYMHSDNRAGWITDKVTRPIMLNTFIDAVENSTVKINDMTILNECLTLVNNKGKIEAAQGKHDDSVIASSIAIQLSINAKQLDMYYDIENKVLL